MVCWPPKLKNNKIRINDSSMSIQHAVKLIVQQNK